MNSVLRRDAGITPYDADMLAADLRGLHDIRLRNTPSSALGYGPTDPRTSGRAATGLGAALCPDGLTQLLKGLFGGLGHGPILAHQHVANSPASDRYQQLRQVLA